MDTNTVPVRKSAANLIELAPFGAKGTALAPNMTSGSSLKCLRGMVNVILIRTRTKICQSILSVYI